VEDKLLEIINHYGVKHQLKYFQSEVFELNEAIIRAENKYEPIQDIDHIAEEIADVRFMLLQFQCKYGITDEEIEEVMEFKGNRQIERIKNEK
jgi:NTP pyrophosphatase (non-canonical NTP hydrolase)